MRLRPGADHILIEHEVWIHTYSRTTESLHRSAQMRPDFKVSLGAKLIINELEEVGIKNTEGHESGAIL